MRRLWRAPDSGCLIPLWDVERRSRSAAQRRSGVQAVAFSDILVTSACRASIRAIGTVLRSLRRDQYRRLHAHRIILSPARNVAGCPPSVTATLAFRMPWLPSSISSGLASWSRFPDLSSPTRRARLAAPLRTRRIDDVWHDDQGSAQTKQIPEPPSTYFHRNIYPCFFKDQTGMTRVIGSGSIGSRSSSTSRTVTRPGPSFP